MCFFLCVGGMRVGNKGKEMEEVARLAWNRNEVKSSLLPDSLALYPGIKGKQCYPENRCCQVSLKPAAFLGPVQHTTKPPGAAHLSSGNVPLHH